jgi:hypothetical protein
MSTAINASVLPVSMYSPSIRCHYMPNISTDLVQFSDVVLGYNGHPKVDGSNSVEIVSYTIQNGNIQLVPFFQSQIIDVHA